MEPQKSNNMYFFFVCALGAQHGSLYQLSVTMSRVTDFILRAHTGTDVSHSDKKKKKNSGEVLEKMQVNGPEG